MKELICAEAKQIDLVDYLASLGYQPQKVRNQDYWYLSPLRDEKTASFKVDRRLNVWYDHGTGKGGDLIDFGTLYFNCSISDLLSRLSEQRPGLSFSFHLPTISPEQHSTPVSFAGEKKVTRKGKLLSLIPAPLQMCPYYITCKKEVSRQKLLAVFAGRWTSYYMESNRPLSAFRTGQEDMSCAANILKVAAPQRIYP